KASPEDIERAKSLYRAGGDAYRQGRYLVAIGAFEEALRLASHPAVIFSAAQAYRLQYFVDGKVEHLERAVALYREYTESVQSGGRRDHAVQHLSQLVPILDRLENEGGGDEARSKVARLIVATSIEGATARIDEGDPTPIPATFEVQPGNHKVSLDAPEYIAKTIDTVAVAGSTVALNVELDPVPGRLTIRAPEGATVLVDGRAVGLAPLRAPVEVRPGAHDVAVTARGHEPYVRDVDIERNADIAVDASLEVTNQRVGAYVLMATAGAMLVGAGVAWGLALQSENDANALYDQYKREGLSISDARRYDSLTKDRSNRLEVTYGLGISAGVFAAGGILLWIFDVPTVNMSGGTAAIAPTIDADGPGLVGHFDW
ncbi:MAG: PEGA domain-containing protein, partial [Myxococcales bacterium]|nr:PEGA domain-containing protein [Myxococcales bacterium]